jgi:LuxR family maltose regulon positive regulatory protein
LLDETNARTILLVAPAGFGKTTLARQWLDERRHGWYRGSTASSDVAALAAGLAKASRALVPDAGSRMMERLGAVGAPPPTPGTLANLLGEDLTEWPADAWLVVDDYHFAMDSVASETFFEELMARCPVRMLVTSRERPSWATASRMLYGEILEVGRGVLALTHEEGRLVLHDRSVEEVAGLLALTEGWPAVIGLASLSGEAVLSGAELPDTLYDYCAEELFQKFPVELRSALCTMALAPSISIELLRALFGREAALIAEAAEEGGFVTPTRVGEFDMHPLLRTFLLRKLEEQGEEDADRAIHELTAYLLRARQWDDALAVAAGTSDPALVEQAIDGALDDLIAEGRLETLKQWIAQARSDAPSPILDLAEAEIAFREGDPAHAFLQATNAASQLPDGHLRLSRAWFRAGQSAHFLDRVEEAQELCELARATAVTPRDAKDALWGLFNAGLDLDDATVGVLLRKIEGLRPLTLDEEIRVAGGSLFFASRWGGIGAALGYARPILTRLKDANPLVQTGFLNSYANALILAARYEEAVTVTDLELERARASSIDFVVPHALLLRGMACMGVRRFRESRENIGLAERKAAGGDAFIFAAAAMLGARLLLFEGRADQAIAALDRDWHLSPVRSLRAEYTATRALSLAALREWDEAALVAEQALKISRTTETQVLVGSVHAIVELGQKQPDAARMAHTAFRVALKGGNVDGFVCAYRAFPGLLASVASSPDLAKDLWPLVTRAHDLKVAQQAGVHTSQQESARWRLTQREDEVLRLLAGGLTNKEIADKLFLAETTVKVHVRHILRKLGVRTRTEAAVRAAMVASGTD